MSVAKEAKQREWSANIFNFDTSNNDTPLFDRKRKSDIGSNYSSQRESSLTSTNRDLSSSFVNKRTEGDLFLFKSTAVAKPSGCLTPGFGSASKKGRDSITM